jgi:ribonuclease HII
MNNIYIDINEIGIDEAGRGSLLGRVYAGAVIWNQNIKECNLINDSKKLTSKKRKIALEWIKNNVTAWGVGYADENEIDKINILEATKLAINRAIEALLTNFNLNKDNIKHIIIDGCGWNNMSNDYNIISIIKGDSKYYSIAAASIIAKEYHDEHINNLCIDEPDLHNKYYLLNNVGYGTKKHIEGIKLYGLSKYHRITYKIKKL